MIRLLLARHGNTFEAGQIAVQVGLQTDLSLTAQGQKQAEEIGDDLRFRKIVPKAIYAGPLKRQMESAKIIQGRLNLPDLLPLEERALTEIDYGVWEGLSTQEIRRRWPKEYAEWLELGKWPDGIFGGSFEEHVARIEHWLQFLRSAFAPNDTVLAITSNGILQFFRKEKVRTGHLCEIDLWEDSFLIQSWNTPPKVTPALSEIESSH